MINAEPAGPAADPGDHGRRRRRPGPPARAGRRRRHQAHPGRPDEAGHRGQRTGPQHARSTAVAAGPRCSRSRTVAATASGSRSSTRARASPTSTRPSTDGYTTGGGLGLGLSGARRLMDEFDLWTKVGEGTVGHRGQVGAVMTRWPPRAGTTADDRVWIACRRRGGRRRASVGPRSRSAPRSGLPEPVLGRPGHRGHRDRDQPRPARRRRRCPDARTPRRPTTSASRSWRSTAGRAWPMWSTSARDGHSTAGTLGIGLGAIARLADEFDVYSRAGSGTVAGRHAVARGR